MPKMYNFAHVIEQLNLFRNGGIFKFPIQTTDLVVDISCRNIILMFFSVTSFDTTFACACHTLNADQKEC